MTKLIVALDTGNFATAAGWIQHLDGHCDMFKVGLELFTAIGMSGVDALMRVLLTKHAGAPARRDIMLDLKLHDIPNTVAGAVRSACSLNPRFITVHASGGGKMIEAAKDAAKNSPFQPDHPKILAVTVLTSLDDDALDGIGFKYGVAPTVTRLANIAMFYGADGIVCSPHEVAALRSELGPHCILVVPGIRLSGTDTNDQARSMTPREAAEAGADYIVVGRPITRAPDPAAAAAAIQAEIA